ncbi:MAG: hypothetical protein AB9907_17410 [Flexilinea sp.]
MKKQTLSILLALVLLLSISIFPVFAQDWDEEDVSGFFGTIEDWDADSFSLAGVDSEDFVFEDYDSKSVESFDVTPEATYEPKSLIDETTAAATATYVKCGDGKLKITVTLTQLTPITGTPYVTYIRSIKISDVTGDPNIATASYKLQDCHTQFGDRCDKVYFDSAGTASLTGYVTVPRVFDGAVNPTFDVTIVQSESRWADPDALNNVVLDNQTSSVDAHAPDLCQTGVISNTLNGYYQQCNGKAEFKVDITVPADVDFIVPSEVTIGTTSYQNYICRYTRYGSSGYPMGGDYCKPGQRMNVRENDKIRFEIMIEKLTNPISETDSTADLPVYWRLGGNTVMLQGDLVSRRGPRELCDAKIVPLSPIELSFGDDNAIEPSGWYNTYEKAVVGLYQKCGRFGVFQIRLRNDGAKMGYVNLPGAVAINGGTPISFFWLSNVAPDHNRIPLIPGGEVTLKGHVYITSIGSQMNSDGPANIAVNFSDLGLYMTGQLYSDHVNWRCY